MTHSTRAKHYRRLADYIARQPEENFYQRRWFCGSAACIAGHTALMLGWGHQRGKVDFDVCSIAANYLGLPDAEQGILFNPGALWQTRDAAVAELLRRARIEEKAARDTAHA